MSRIKSRARRIIGGIGIFLVIILIAVLFTVRLTRWRQPFEIVAVKLGTGMNSEARTLITLTNRSNRSISYRGYAPDTPIHTFGVWSNDQWNCLASGYCGNDVRTWVCPKGGVITFRTYFPEVTNHWRFGVLSPTSIRIASHIPFRMQKLLEDEWYYEWSNPIPAPTFKLQLSHTEPSIQ